MELFTQKVVTKLSKIWVWDPRSGIQGSKRPQSRIPDPDPQHWFYIIFNSFCLTIFQIKHASVQILKFSRSYVPLLSKFSMAKNVQVGFGFGSESENQINGSTVPGPWERIPDPEHWIQSYTKSLVEIFFRGERGSMRTDNETMMADCSHPLSIAIMTGFVIPTYGN
jgi:hypothetical protein